MLDIGIQELLVIMVLALLIFGPDKLPDLGRRLGRAMREFRRASDEFRSTVEQNLQINIDQDISAPAASPASLEPASASSASGGATEGSVAEADGHGAGVSTSEPVGSGAAEGQAADDLLEPYWTSRGGRLLHRRECAWRARVPASE
ncbi:MAG TPA: twin-arginine translocase TatA/TatE family subunit, partial [Methylomirabilota bacterium]